MSFPKGISPKVNAIAQPEFKLAYYDVAIQHIIHYAIGRPIHSALCHIETKSFINYYPLCHGDSPQRNQQRISVDATIVLLFIPF